MISFSSTRRALLGGALAAATDPAFAQEAGFPSRPVRILVPFLPGGSVDLLSRLLGEKLRERLGQPFISENRAGANGTIAMDVLAHAAPDGYTLAAITVSQMLVSKHFYPHMTIEPERDIVPVSLTWELPNVAVIAADKVPARDMAGFIAWAKARPNGISIGHPGVGSGPHMAAEMFPTLVGAKATTVSYRGAAQVVPALLSGEIDFAIDNLASYVPAIQQGLLIPLAVTVRERWPRLPQVPTMVEVGLPQVMVTSCAMFSAPAGTPMAIRTKFSEALIEIAKDPALQDRFLDAGAQLLSSTPAEAASRTTGDRQLWADLVRISGAGPT